MYNEYWGFNRCPFAGKLDTDRFYESPTHEEALARLSYVVDQGRAGAVVIGPAGVGKTLVLEVFAQRMRRPDREIILVHCPGFGTRELFFDLAQQMRLLPEPGESAAELWRRVRDHVLANRGDSVQTVIIVDQAHLLSSDGQQRGLHLLYQLDPHPQAKFTVVLSGRPELLEQTAPDLIEWVDLGVTIEPLDERETGNYISHSTAWAGRNEPVFTADAVRKVFELSGGVPRHINRVCDLALLAACSEERTRVTAEVVESVYRDLIPAGAYEPLPASAGAG